MITNVSSFNLERTVRAVKSIRRPSMSSLLQTLYGTTHSLKFVLSSVLSDMKRPTMDVNLMGLTPTTRKNCYLTRVTIIHCFSVLTTLTASIAPTTLNANGAHQPPLASMLPAQMNIPVLMLTS